MKLETAIQSKGFANEKTKSIVNIMYTAYHVKSKIANTLKDYALTPEQYNVLRILKGKHPEKMCVKDIAGRLVERSSNVPRILDRLSAKKLIERCQSDNDKRESQITILPTGINLLATATVTLDENSAKLTDLSEDSLEQLNDLLDRFLKD